jgi:hypothetical protein
MNEYAYNQLLSLLQQAAAIVEENKDNVTNFDLEDLGLSLEGIIQEIEDLGTFVGEGDDEEFDN